MGEWGFFVDENLEPRITYELEQRGFEAENVRDTVGRGADDSAVLEYARERDYVIVTSDVTDFRPLDDDEHCGVLLVYDDRVSAHEIATAIADLVAALPGRDSLRTQYPLDDWF